MRLQKRLIGFWLYALLLSGCMSDQDSIPVAGATAINVLAPISFKDAGSISPSPQPGFASLPDHGKLFSYDSKRDVVHRGAYASYPVRISEEHALHAIRTGELVMNAPNGELFRLQYVRHLENSNGNWTWIGRDADGAHAVLTFGEKAVIGTIQVGGNEPFYLTTAAGGSWLVARQPAKLAMSLRTAWPDHLMPPRSVSMAAASRAMVQPERVQATKLSKSVDVLVGYTAGFATAVGGQSQAITRLTNMVAIANQEYAESGVDMRIRLVHAMQVNYADNSDNGEALEELSGYKSRSADEIILPNSVPGALHAAREEYGADLVTLVRAFRAPENKGCGMAWLLDGDQSAISDTERASFGYSVLSLGVDLDEDSRSTYSCNEETFVEGINHIFGKGDNSKRAQAADAGLLQPGADPPGADPDMHGDDDLRNGMAVAASFRATAVPENTYVKGDINGDGKSDLLFRYYKSVPNNFEYWIMNGTSVVRKGANSLGASYKVATTGDFNGDGKLDLIWSSSNRDVVMWRGNGTGFVKTVVGSYGENWSIEAAGDIDGNGKSDLVLRSSYEEDSMDVMYWFMDGPLVGRTVKDDWDASPVARLAATGDFNRDGNLDLFWSASWTSSNLWRGFGTGQFVKTSLRPNWASGWFVVGTADVDEDGRSDLILRYKYTTFPGNIRYLITNGQIVTETRTDTLDVSYTLAATGDYNGDGRTDLVWTSANRDILMWFGSPTGFVKTTAGSYGPGWSIVSPGL